MNYIQILAKEYADVTTCPGINNIPGNIAHLISLIYTVIEIGVPILLIIFGMLDLGKAVIASKEDEIKKGQKTFISRIIAAIIVFFVFGIVKLVVSLAEPNDSGIWDCVDKLINYNSVQKTAE